MKRAIPVFGLLLLSGLLHSAHAETDDDDARPSPSDAHQTRPLSGFHGIDLAGTLGVEVVAGKPGIELIGDNDLFDKVSTTIKDGVLVINTRYPRDRHNIHMRVIVSTGELSSLLISGTGQIKALAVSSPTLSVGLPGTGEIKLAGSTGALRIDVDGTGSISAKKLVAKSAVVSMSGTGSATLDATDSVDANLTGTGSIDVHGHPARVTKHNSGLGSIHVR